MPAGFVNESNRIGVEGMKTKVSLSKLAKNIGVIKKKTGVSLSKLIKKYRHDHRLPRGRGYDRNL